MPFAPHIRVTAIGRLGTSGERFQYGLNLGREDGGSLPAVDSSDNFDLWDDMAADLRAFHVSTGSGIHQQAVLTEVKFATIGADGKYLEDPYVSDIADAAGSMSDGAAVKTLPQAALAVTLDTNRRGPTGRGRFFLPMPSTTIETATFLVPEAFRDGVATAAVTLINALNDQPGVDEAPQLQVVVASTKGYNTYVTGVRVGKVVDTIRSRRRALPETYDLPIAITDAD